MQPSSSAHNLAVKVKTTAKTPNNVRGSTNVQKEQDIGDQ
jgi:hypothetical protein